LYGLGPIKIASNRKNHPDAHARAFPIIKYVIDVFSMSTSELELNGLLVKKPL
jgi:hypothetical protein